MSKHTVVAEIEAQFTFPGLADGEFEVAYPKIEITYSHTKGCPAVMYQRNGDPGWPAEPDEIELLSAKLIDGDGLTPAQDRVDDWARDWLENQGYDQACEAAHADEP